MSFTPPTIAQFKAQFPRDWPYGAGLDTVQDNDILNAINQGQQLFNPVDWSDTIPAGYTQSEDQIGYLFLTAHILVLNIQASGGLVSGPAFGGINSSGGGIVSSKTVGSISGAYAIPDFVFRSPSLSQFMRTSYGQQYLAMWLPKRPGRRVTVIGGEPGAGIPIGSTGEIFDPASLGPAQI